MDVPATETSINARPRAAYLAPVILVASLIAYLTGWLLAKGPALAQTLDVLNMVGPLLATVCCFIAARCVSHRKAVIFWGLLTAAMLFSLLAESVWAIYELARGVMDPFPTIGDLFWLLAYPLQFAAIVSLVSFKGAGRVAAIGVSIGALIVAVVAGTVMALFIMLPSIDTSASTLSNVVTLLYPAGDVLLLAALGALVLLPTQETRGMPKGLWWIAASFLVDVVADIVYSTKEISGTYETGSWVDLLWPLAYALIAAAAIWQFTRRRQRPCRV